LPVKVVLAPIFKVLHVDPHEILTREALKFTPQLHQRDILDLLVQVILQ
jgi:hypothetical protein